MYRLGQQIGGLFQASPDERRAGIALKRLTVDVGHRRERFAELVNQLATVERLLDVFIWLRSAHGDPHVVACHPTTSSNAAIGLAGLPDHDLVVSRLQAPMMAVEVFDVVAVKRDSNRKLAGDLDRLNHSLQIWPDLEAFAAMPRERAEHVLRGPLGSVLKPEWAPQEDGATWVLRLSPINAPTVG